MTESGEHLAAIRCVAWGCKAEQRVGFVCQSHYERGARWLREVEEEAAILSPLLSMEVAHGNRGAGLASERSPAKLDAIALWDKRSKVGDGTDPEADRWGGDLLSVLDVLHSWANTVREERALTKPTRTIVGIRAPGAAAGPYCHHLCGHESCARIAPRWEVPAPATVVSERRILTTHWDWICNQPWIDELIDQLRPLVKQLKRVNETIELPAGTCDTVYGTEMCGGKVWHILIKHDDEADEPGFRCGTCRRTWTGTEAVRKRNALWVEEQARKAAG